MPKNNMKDTEYYKTGKQIANLKLATKKSAESAKKRQAHRISEYNKNPSVCNECDSNIEYDKRTNKFCSRSCSATYNNRNRKYIITDEIKEKISKTAKKNHDSATVEQRKQRVEKRLSSGMKKPKHAVSKYILDTPTEMLSTCSIKKKIVYEQEGKCLECELDKWNGKEIPLELDHIDGNHDNNIRTNLRILCPNCHAQTDTWRGKSRKRKYESYTDEQLLAAYNVTGSIARALKSLGVRPGGSNRKRLTKLINATIV